MADEVTTVGQTLSALRMEMARRFDLIPTDRHDILLGGRVPGLLLGRRRAALGRRAPSVHRARRAISTIPANLSSRAYDLVLDGAEIGGGSIRINRLDVQERVFELLGIGAGGGAGPVRLPPRRAPLRRPAARRDRDGHRPDRRRRSPGVESIRDVIAFPKAASGADPLTGAPAPVDPAQLRELGLRLV